MDSLNPDLLRQIETISAKTRNIGWDDLSNLARIDGNIARQKLTLMLVGWLASHKVHLKQIIFPCLVIFFSCRPELKFEVFLLSCNIFHLLVHPKIKVPSFLCSWCMALRCGKTREIFGKLWSC